MNVSFKVVPFIVTFEMFFNFGGVVFLWGIASKTFSGPFIKKKLLVLNGNYMKLYTLPKTNSSGPKRKRSYSNLPFSGAFAVSFREGNMKWDHFNGIFKEKVRIFSKAFHSCESSFRNVQLKEMPYFLGVADKFPKEGEGNKFCLRWKADSWEAILIINLWQ